jgi:Domain of unknown function (DUF4340)
MKWGRMLAAGVLLAGLAAILWWSNGQEKAKEGKPAADAPPKILALGADTIQQIEIRHRGEDPITLNLNGSTWQMTSPKPLAVDGSAVSAITSAAVSVDAERVVDPNVNDLKAYGLAPASIEVAFGTKNGKTSKLLIGDNTPAGSAVYAKVDGDPRLFTMATYSKTAFDKEAKDLRDKRLLPFTQGKLSRIEITAQKQTYEFVKKGESEWQIVKPNAMRADSAQTDDLVRQLSSAQMDLSGVQDDKKYAAAFNSAPVLAIAKVTDQDGTKTLEIRKVKDDYYAKSSAVEGVYKVAKTVSDGLDKPVDAYRNKKIFDFGFSDPTHIEVVDGTKTSIFDKSGENWMSGGKKMDSTSVQAFADRLRDLSATKFGESGFTTPVVTITVVSNQGKLHEKVEIAPAASGGNFLARRDGDGSFYELEAGVIKDLRQAVGDVRQAQPETKKK